MIRTDRASHRRTSIGIGMSLSAIIALAACSGGGGGGGATDGRGEITIWYSNNEQEVAWGKQMVEAWNAEHPDEQIKAQEIPAGASSEEVIGAAITAGNAPCLIYNTAPVAVAQFEKQGGLVALSSFDDGDAYITERSGETAEQYTSADGQFSTSVEQDGQLLELTGQMPLRQDLTGTYPDYFAANPTYEVFGDQAARTVEVPNVANGVAIWQKFRDAYSKAVIFGEGDLKQELEDAAAEVDKLANQP